MKARKFDEKFDRGGALTRRVDLSRARRASRKTRRGNVDFPAWMIESLDQEAGRLGVTRQSIIKMWLAERRERDIHAHDSARETASE